MEEEKMISHIAFSKNGLLKADSLTSKEQNEWKNDEERQKAPFFFR